MYGIGAALMEQQAQQVKKVMAQREQFMELMDRVEVRRRIIPDIVEIYAEVLVPPS